MGPKGSWTPFHADVFRSYSWSANVCGRKRWLLYPAGHEEFLKDCHGNLPFDVTAPDLRDKRIYPRYSQSQPPLEIIQESGEIVFVPSGWHHQVYNLVRECASHRELFPLGAAASSCLMGVEFQRFSRDVEDLGRWRGKSGFGLLRGVGKELRHWDGIPGEAPGSLEVAKVSLEQSGIGGKCPAHGMAGNGMIRRVLPKPKHSRNSMAWNWGEEEENYGKKEEEGMEILPGREKFQLGATWDIRKRPCLWNGMILKIPSIPQHSGILGCSTIKSSLDQRDVGQDSMEKAARIPFSRSLAGKRFQPLRNGTVREPHPGCGRRSRFQVGIFNGIVEQRRSIPGGFHPNAKPRFPLAPPPSGLVGVGIFGDTKRSNSQPILCREREFWHGRCLPILPTSPSVHSRFSRCSPELFSLRKTPFPSTTTGSTAATWPSCGASCRMSWRPSSGKSAAGKMPRMSGTSSAS
ncbi:2-oxoglutarate and iron-dependent oxygenase JMJD4 isoform X2 [Corvus moneduloides]|nr:2-oxoglutarate and iron-dependent oxygenase JMJD4 isoform X2 [Corvus moneduloides]